MGNNSKHPVVNNRKKKKKKGRPSLSEIQKRSLRLQEQQNPNPNSNPNSNPTPSPNSHLRRRATRRNPDPDGSDASSDEDDGGSGRRKEKKLKLVHRLSGDDVDLDSVSKGEKGTDSSLQEERLEQGPSSALPDKKLLELVLDRLQKKDTYGVYSEPVDPEELPDYFDIIEHPMDFGTVRKNLDGGAYSNLEHFERDVFLISSNAMKYNAPDTIYFRQARTINELSKKSFESLKDGTLGTEQEPKPVGRRGRPPNKNKKPNNNNNNINNNNNNSTGKNSTSDFSFDTPKPNNNNNNNKNNNNSVGRDNVSNNNDNNNNSMDNNNNNHWSLTYDLTKRTSLGGERNSSNEMFSWLNEQRVDKNEPSPAYGWKGTPAKYGSAKKPGGIVDETQRKTYKISQQLLLTSPDEFSILNTFDRDRKQLVPVGIQVEHVYARSLARFAAKLGPLGWSIAEEKIKRILPAGTRFGPGWVIDGEPVMKSKPEPDSSAKLDHRLLNQNNTINNDSNDDNDDDDKKERNEEVQRTTSCVTSENNCSEGRNNNYNNNNNNNNNNQVSKAMLMNGFNAPIQNMGKIMVPHSQTFRPNNSNNKNNNNNNNQRHGLNLAPDLNVGFQQLSSPNSNSKSNLNSSSKVESTSQQQPDLALQL